MYMPVHTARPLRRTFTPPHPARAHVLQVKEVLRYILCNSTDKNVVKYKGRNKTSSMPRRFSFAGYHRISARAILRQQVRQHVVRCGD